MKSQKEIEKLVKELIKKILAPNYILDFDGNVRDQFDANSWSALAEAIREDPAFKKLRLWISNKQMRRAMTIEDIAAIIRANGPTSEKDVARSKQRGAKQSKGSSRSTKTTPVARGPSRGERHEEALTKYNWSIPRESSQGAGPFSSVIIKKASSSSEFKSEEKVDAEYSVWYGTNRAPVTDDGRVVGYSSDRDNVTHLGKCRVFVPKSHKIGSTGSPFWKRILTMTDDRLKLLSISDVPDGEFWKGVAEKLASCSDDDRHAVVFLHGFNVSFEDAALRAAQFGFDLSIKGIMAFFSWPSQGSVDGYLADGATIEVSEDAISEFLTSFAQKSGAKSVHIIAHSMGNRGLLRAVQRIAAQAQQASGVRFDQIILAAPDVDAGLFKILCAAYVKIARRTTLYVSEKDHAVELSKFLHQFDRVGYAPPIFVAPGIDTINVTGVDFSMLGHGFVAEARSVLADIHELIRNGSPPEKRFGLREAIVGADKYWDIGR